jgi:hypothetical protein
MSELRKAAEMALEALDCEPESFVSWLIGLREAREALRQALAQQEQEPFIYVREDNEKPFGGYEHCSEVDAGAFPVYTAPPISDYHEGWEEGFKAGKPEWIGLTEYQKLRFAEKFRIDTFAVEEIEAKLKEKNS